VEPSATFQVRVRARTEEARLVLADAQGAMVPSSGSTEVALDTEFQLAPTEPLRPGSSYVLRLEGLAGRIVRDVNGRGYEPVTFRVLVTGRQDPVPARRKAARHRRGSG
jgi:hypothetical protein